METQNNQSTMIDSEPVEFKTESNSKSSNLKKIIIIIALLAVLTVLSIFSYYLGTQKNNSQQLTEGVSENIQPVAAPTSLPNIPSNQESTQSPEPILEYSGWEDYSTSTYTLKYPSNVEVRTEYGSTAVLTMWGPTQTKDTELFDGISLRVQPVEVPLSAKSYAETKITEIQQMGNADITSQLEPYELKNITGWTFSTTGLGVHKYIIIGGENGMIMELINSTVDPNKNGYEEIVTKIIESIKFIN